MSPRAAARLESLGFTDVYDYVAGKADWKAGGRQIEGSEATTLTALAALTDDDVLVAPDMLLGDVVSLVQKAGREAAIVVSASNVVLGRIRGKALDGDLSQTAVDAMRPGPSTIRPDMDLAEAVNWMQSAGIRSVLVTTPEGAHMGTLTLERAEKTLA